MDIRLLAGEKKQAHEAFDSRLSGYGKIRILYGADNFRLFSQTAEFKSSQKFSWRGYGEIFNQPFHGCVAFEDGNIKAIYFFAYHPERIFHPLSAELARLMDKQMNIAVALSGLPLSLNTSYIQWFSSKFKKNGCLIQEVAKAVGEEKKSGRLMPLAELLQPIQDWLERNTHEFQLDTSIGSKSVVRQVHDEVSRRSRVVSQGYRDAQRSLDWPDLRAGHKKYLDEQRALGPLGFVKERAAAQKYVEKERALGPLGFATIRAAAKRYIEEQRALGPLGFAAQRATREKWQEEQ
jgi:hypothetical protein